MSKEYESLMEGLKEDLKDIQTYGEPQGRTTVEKHCDSEKHRKLETALGYYIQNNVSIGLCAQIAGISKEEFIKYLGANGTSIFCYDDEREFVEEMNNA